VFSEIQAIAQMSESPIKKFQQALAPRLRALFAGVPVESEWASMRGEDGLYSPRLDLAVGPFAIRELVYVSEFNSLLETHRHFVRLLYDFSVANIKEFGTSTEIFDFDEVAYRNANARCFLAFEIENQVSRKHLMGGAINAAALGRLGIAVGWTREKVKAFVKLRSYLLFLARVGKNTFHPFNLLVLSKSQLIEAVVACEKKAVEFPHQIP
jgi:hypothetical protein